MRLLRKLFSTLLLVTLLLSTGLPLFGLESRGDAGLPACCQRDGKHHCAMSRMVRARQDAGTFRFCPPLERCPYCPATMGDAHANHWSFRAVQEEFATSTETPLELVSYETRRWNAPDRSRQERGPPTETPSHS